MSAEPLDTFRRLVARWGLDDDQAAALLGLPPEAVAAATLTEDAVARIAELARIARALNTLYSHHLADRWIIQPQADGQWPLDRLTEGGLPAFTAMREGLEERL